MKKVHLPLLLMLISILSFSCTKENVEESILESSLDVETVISEKATIQRGFRALPRIRIGNVYKDGISSTGCTKKLAKICARDRTLAHFGELNVRILSYKFTPLTPCGQ